MFIPETKRLFYSVNRLMTENYVLMVTKNRQNQIKLLLEEWVNSDLLFFACESCIFHSKGCRPIVRDHLSSIRLSTLDYSILQPTIALLRLS